MAIGITTALSWIILLVYHQPEGLIRTALLVPLVALIGVLLICRTSDGMHDANVQRISFLFLLKIPLVLIVLYWGWVPELDAASADVGYDPQRYYFQAIDVVEVGFESETWSSVNYGGILLYYASVFLLCGSNPAAPALVNCLTTLIAALALVEATSVATGTRRNAWVIGLMIMLPELVWFDALTSRESVAMTLLTTGTLPLGIMFLQRKTSRPLRFPILVSIASLSLLAIIRTTMLLPAAATIIFLFLLLRVNARQRLAGCIAICSVLALLAIAPRIVTNLRSFDFGYLQTFQLSREAVTADNITWSEKSLGQRLIPSNAWEEVLFAPIRLAFYIITPLPGAGFHVSGLVRGAWQDWQNLCSALSALIYIFLLPRCVASLIASIRDPQLRPQLLLHVPLWIALITIALGNVIIVARYRIMAAGLLWACGCLADSRHRTLTAVCNFLWFLALMVGGVTYFVYKS